MVISIKVAASRTNSTYYGSRKSNLSFLASPGFVARTHSGREYLCGQAETQMFGIEGDCCGEHINALNDAREKARNSDSDSLFTPDVLRAMVDQEKHWAEIKDPSEL
jgi:hypothetical protein